MDIQRAFPVPQPNSCPPVLADPRALGGFVAVLGIVWVLLHRATESVATGAIVVGLPLAGVLTVCRSLFQWVRLLLRSIPWQPPPPILLLGVVLTVALGVLLVGLVVSGHRSSVLDGSGDEDDEELAELSRIAGSAADRIEANDDVTNEVYRAWRRMVGLLDVDNPDAQSPAEFADAARRTGMAEVDVSTLTELFCEVRYGGLDADERVPAAVAALRRIEEAYGAEEP